MNFSVMQLGFVALPSKGMEDKKYKCIPFILLYVSVLFYLCINKEITLDGVLMKVFFVT